MIIMALDISPASTGVAIGDGSGPPRSFERPIPGTSRGQRGLAFARWLRDLIVLEGPDLVAYEAPIMFSRKGSVDAMRILMGLAFQVEVVCASRAPLRAIEVNIQAWRKLFLGQGRPADPKGDCVRMCGLLGWPTGGSHDRADSCGVWAWAHFHHGNRQGIMKALSAGSVRAMGVG